MLVLFLLFVWNVLIGFDDWKRSKGTRLMVVANAIGIAAMLYFLTAVDVSANFAHNTRAGLYENINFRPFIISSRRTENYCITMRRFAGRWRVVERRVGHYDLDIPAQWIELKPWGYVYAQDSSWSQPYTDWWRAPYQSRYSDDKRWRSGRLFGATWDFDLQGEYLILSSPEEWFEYEWQRSTVTLQREPIPDQPIFPNPHATVR